MRRGLSLGGLTVDASEGFDPQLEEGEEGVPVSGIALLVDWAVDGFCWGLDIADQHLDACFGEVVHDSLPDARTAACYDGRFASEFVAWESG
jgi:hypothetical protein